MKAFVVGNIVMDESYSVDSLPTQGESIFGQKTGTDLGGKGANQAIVLGRSGVPTVLIAATGTDAQAEAMALRLETEPVDARFVQMDGMASDNSIIMTDQKGSNTIVTTTGCSRALSANAVTDLMQDASPGDLLVLQGNLALPTNKALIIWAGSKRLKVAMNPSPYEEGIGELLAGIDFLFLNEKEARRLTGKAGEAAVRQLLGMNIGNVVLTMGAKGALAGNRSSIWETTACDCEVVDTTGAGDTFQSTAIGLSIARQIGLNKDALRKAAQAAALTVSRQGTIKAFPTIAELESLTQKP